MKTGNQKYRNPKKRSNYQTNFIKNTYKVLIFRVNKKTRNGHTIEVLDAKDDNNKIHGKIHVYHKFDDYDISLSSDEEKKEIYVWSKADADKREKKLKKCKEDLEKLEKDLAAKEEQWKKDKEKLEKDIKDKKILKNG